MANEQRPLDPDYLFNIFKLNKWFAISSIVLLVGTLLMVKDDYDKEWKQWQRKFREIEIERTQKDIQNVQGELASNSDYQAATKALEEAKLTSQKNERAALDLERQIDKLTAERYAVYSNFQNTKSIQDSLVYQVEEATEEYREASEHLNSDSDYQAALAEFNAFKAKTKDKKAALQAKRNLEKYTVERDEKKSKWMKLSASLARTKGEARFYQGMLDNFDAKLNQARNDLAALGKDKSEAADNVKKLETQLSRLKKKEQSIGRSFANDVFRNAPLIDFIDPSLRVKEIITKDALLDYNFTKVPRADACTTCHVAIDKPGFEDQPNPLKTHPKLELFLSSTSPHKIEDYGCTVCHQGLGGGLTFTNAAHAPKNEKQGEEWEKKYHWHRMKHWDEPMLPLQYTEATCLGCHAKDVDVLGSTRLSRGILLVERSGCYGCHKIEGWEGIRKPGPSLEKISSKVSPDWMWKWIKDPRSFRPETNMPKIFDLSNSNDKKSQSRNNAEIWAIATYLGVKSKPYDAGNSTTLGNAEQGRKVFGSVGCLGCHRMDDFEANGVVDEAVPTQIKRGFGPNLSQVGSKVSVPWLKTWLKNPKDYWHETRMPSLRLSNSEIEDLAAYLMSKKNSAFEQLRVPPLEAKELENAARDYLSRRIPAAQAEEQIKRMTKDELAMFLGEKAIANYGCFGCHQISGFEDAKPIGPELTLEASKNLSRFDFGFVDVEKTVDGYIRQKLKDPRSYDKDRIREPLDRLRMPYFQFNEEELDDLVTFVMGLKKYSIQPGLKPMETPARVALRAGRRMVHDNNCRGCHILEKVGGQVLAFYEDRSSGPPNLATEGRKVQTDWLYHFLDAPSTIRPWLSIRMPTFGFNEEEKNNIIKYFRGVDGMDLSLELPKSLAETNEARTLAQESFKNFQCAKCHQAPPYGADTDMTSLAPSFRLAPNRLRHEWVADWLRDPQKLLPGTRMPNLFYSEGQPMYPDAEERVKAIQNYLFTHDVYTGRPLGNRSGKMVSTRDVP
jgi:cbb3-type cytochrome oxidase cytochrome c subunit